MITTERLILRGWEPRDHAPVAAITADPEVMRYFHVTRTRAQSDAWVARAQAHIERHRFGIWAVELRASAELIGFVGLSTVPDILPCAPAVEAVWTLAASAWRHGYCAEAADAAVDDGFARLGLDEVVAFTAAINMPSRRVMEKIGMIRDAAADFVHPRVPAGHELAPHVLYRRRPA